MLASEPKGRRKGWEMGRRHRHAKHLQVNDTWKQFQVAMVFYLIVSKSIFNAFMTHVCVAGRRHSLSAVNRAYHGRGNYHEK